MINVSIALMGAALQDGDEPAAEPTFKHGLTGGGLVQPERTVDQSPVACGLRANASNSNYVSEVNVAVDFETMAYADALTLYAYAAMGSIQSSPVDEKEGYFRHVVTLGSTIPMLTFWGQVGDSSLQTVHRVDGAKVDTLSLSFEGNAPLDIGVTAAGTDATLFGSWSDASEPSCFDGYFVPTGGTFLIDTSTQTPSEAVVTQGSFELSNNLDPKRAAGQAVPSILAEGKLTTSVSVTVIPEDWSLIRKLLTGSDSGTKVTSSVVYGSAKWSFEHNADPDMTMEVEFMNVPWNCETPEVDPEGNSAEVEFSADDVGIASKDGTPVKITIVNKVESYTA